MTTCVAIYVAGAGTRGVNQAVRQAGLAGRLVVVAHELTAHTRTGLEEGSIDAVIAQNVGHLARSALRVLRAKADRLPSTKARNRFASPSSCAKI